MNSRLAYVKRLRSRPYKGRIPKGPPYQHGDIQAVAFEDSKSLIVARLNFEAEGEFYTLHRWCGIGPFGFWDKTELYGMFDALLAYAL